MVGWRGWCRILVGGWDVVLGEVVEVLHVVCLRI